MLSVGLITSDNKHLSHVLGLALDRFHIEITLNGATAGEALAHPEACGVDIWVARLPGERAETLSTLLPGRSDPTQPGPLAVVCDGSRTQVAAAMANGASAIVLPDDTVFDTAAAIHAAAACALFVSPRLLRRVDGRLTDVLTARVPSPKVLTEREERVLSLMSAGMSNAQIGRTLFISPTTVSTHVGNILRKLEAGNRTAAVITALEMSLIAPPVRRP
ncbi:response regulator transcription factor [Streptomyces sp. DSM 42041]|uniref:Response regulator transcription factor n=1 Tax=Streptomyces hazeniae TaxID=3075538 RepID=A0ABU2NKT3_9ACTN|nr:response regulator transcription factor [Streptomyces sp. DSM 42041]MDT0377589.1 response regulator transcription factor [Streptomyces sp. DSM 42041]